MKLVQRYYNSEAECIETLETLRDYYDNEMPEEERQELTFEEFIGNCCDKNGALTPIPDEFKGKLYFDFQHNDIVDRRTMLNRLETEYGFDEFTPISEAWEYFWEVETR